MGYSAKVGSFNIDTTKTAGQTQAVTGVGFTPKIVMFWWGGSAQSSDTVAGGNMRFGYGAGTDSSNQWCVVGYSEDNVGTSDTARGMFNNAVIYLFLNAITVESYCILSSLDADGFTLQMAAQFTAALRVSYLVLGGTDLTNAKVGMATMPTVTGNYNVTGIGFQPDALITSTYFFTVNATGSQVYFCLGMATGASNQGVVSIQSDDAVGTSNTMGYGYNGEVLGTRAGSHREAFVSFGADGWTNNHLEGGSAYNYGYIALKGGQYLVGDLTTRTDGNDISETVGFQPVGILFASANRALSTQDTVTANARLSIGAGTSTSNRASQAISDEDNLDTTETAYANYDSAVYAHVKDDAIEALMDIKSIDPTGFTCVMDDTETAGCWVTYLAIGANAATVKPWYVYAQQ